MDDHIAIITVVYRNYSVLPDFIESLQAQTSNSFRLFIADASETPEKITSPFTVTILPIENKGYAHGVNVCISKALQEGYTKFCVVNDDTILDTHFVEAIQSSLQHHPSSLIGAKIYYAKGYEFHKKRYSPAQIGNIIWFAGGDIDWNHIITPHRGVDMPDEGQFDKPSRCDFITGCCTVFDSALVKKIGKWDESYFLYYEDADYSVRALRAGCEIWYDPAIVLWHKNAQSTDGSGSSLHSSFQKKSALRFALKYAPLRTKFHVILNYFFKT